MAKRQRIDLSRFRIISLAVSIVIQDDEDDDLVVAGIRRQSPIYWMGPYLRARTDPTQRNTLAKLEMDFLRLGCHSDFHSTTRMPPTVYKELLELVRPLITRQDTNYRKAITAEERLSMTIRYLSRGDSVTTLHQAYLVGESTVLVVVRDTCRAIYHVLHKKYLKCPETKEDWLAISKGFHDHWNFPHVIGAVDGKHCRITKPRNTGSLYYNYKLFFSIVLLAVVDAEYKFIFVDVGAEGRASDATLWSDSGFYRAVTNVEENTLNVPPPAPVPGYPGTLPFFFVGDEAFGLQSNMMKPFPTTRLTPQQRIYNYRLSRCRRIVENAFGILSTRFRIFRKEIEQEPEGARDVVLACVVLHNFLREKAAKAYIPKPSVDWEDKDYTVHQGIWRAEEPLQGRSKSAAKNHSKFIKNMRTNLSAWCLTKEGEVPWQYKVVLGKDFY